MVFQVCLWYYLPLETGLNLNCILVGIMMNTLEASEPQAEGLLWPVQVSFPVAAGAFIYKICFEQLYGGFKTVQQIFFFSL